VSSSALLEFRNVSKAFGDCVANRRVDFDVQSGTIHALVGENGAGKSTIMKIFFGMFQRDTGSIALSGKPIDFASPLEAKNIGIGMVHQHFMLAGPMTALEHIFLDESEVGSLFKPLNKTRKRQELQAISEKYRMPVPWDEKIENLSVGYQQRIEILKLLYNKADILILDEPTAVLTPQETEALFHQLRDLKKSGKTILLITHKLKEVMSLADQVTVFRQGETVKTLDVSETSPLELSELMVGRKLQNIQPSTKPMGQTPRLELKDLSLPTLSLHGMNLKVQVGEIVGIAGIEGNGQSQLIEFLLGPDRFQIDKGEVLLDGKSIAKQSARDLKALGCSYFPEDRLSHGAVVQLDLQENFLLGLQRSSEFQASGVLKPSALRQHAAEQIQKFDVRPPDLNRPFQSLSGGNQQKLVVARELFRNPSFLLAAQPTRGVDIGAMERIHLEILDLRNRGGSILLISSDLDELMKLSDRILVFYQGRIAGEMHKGAFNEMKLGHLMTGVQA
jgi:general nucleoside transport system ATP-binding protein